MEWEVDYLKNNDGKYSFCEHEEAEYAVIPIDEYYGFLSALRIVRDRAKQQIDKNTADEHGYTLLRARYKHYEPRNSEKAWFVTKRTPHSAKLPFVTASDLIKMDLKEFYHFRDAKKFRKSSGYSFSEIEIIRNYNYYRDHDEDEINSIKNTDMKEMLDYFVETDGKLAFEIAEISCNVGLGVYEVSYWATKPT